MQRRGRFGAPRRAALGAARSRQPVLINARTSRGRPEKTVSASASASRSSSLRRSSTAASTARLSSARPNERGCSSAVACAQCRSCTSPEQLAQLVDLGHQRGGQLRDRASRIRRSSFASALTCLRQSWNCSGVGCARTASRPRPRLAVHPGDPGADRAAPVGHVPVPEAPPDPPQRPRGPAQGALDRPRAAARAGPGARRRRARPATAAAPRIAGECRAAETCAPAPPGRAGATGCGRRRAAAGRRAAPRSPPSARISASTARERLSRVRTSCTRSSCGRSRSRAARTALRSCSPTIRRRPLPTGSRRLIRYAIGLICIANAGHVQPG